MDFSFSQKLKHKSQPKNPTLRHVNPLSLLSLLCLLGFSAACTGTLTGITPQESPTQRAESATYAPTQTPSSSKPPPPTLTQTPTTTETVVPTPTVNWNDFSWLPAPTIGVTQIPPIVKPPTGEDDVFLYKDVIVTITFDLSIGWGAEGKGYLNLDNLEDNGKTNSDVFILAEEGTGLYYSLWPANNALDYWPPTGSDFDSCVAHLNEFGGYTFFDPSLSYCFLTDERRIGIVQEVADSFREVNGIATKSYRITVYKQKVDR